MSSPKSTIGRLIAVAVVGVLLAALAPAVAGEFLAKGTADLAIDAVKLGQSDVHGQTMLRIAVRVENRGGGDAGAFDVTIKGPGFAESRPVGSLKAGASKDITVSVAYPRAGGSIIAIADARNVVTESNKANNSASAAILVRAVAL